jgi:hypothetical protein
MEINVELDRYYVILEIFHEHISHAPKYARHPILLESLDENFMIHPDHFGHNVQYTLSYDPLFRHSENLTCHLVTVSKAANSFIIIIGKYGEC